MYCVHPAICTTSECLCNKPHNSIIGNGNSQLLLHFIVVSRNLEPISVACRLN